LRVFTNNPLTVLFLISSEGYFGVENMLVTLATALVKQRCRCIVGVFSDSRFQHTEIADRACSQGLEVELVPCAARCDWRAVSRIRKLLAEHSVDILHPHGYKADLYSYAAAWPRRVAIVATSHNWPNRLWSMRAYAVLDRWAMRGFERIAVVSDVVADILHHSGIRADRVRTIFNGVEIELFRSAEPTLRNEVASSGETVVGFVGRFVPDKGGEIFLHAARKVLRHYSNTRFVLVGDGPCRRDWDSLAVQLGIRAQVEFTGVRHDMPGVYASLDALVLPSLCEAMPMSVLEAMAAGKPVIASRVGAVPKLVVPKQTGVLIEPGDIDGLSAAIIQLLNDPKQAHRLGENGYARAAEHFSADAMATRYLELYREVVADRENARKSVMAWGAN
jgi:glycosyltransferase involved in cell wall biosynthesis